MTNVLVAFATKGGITQAIAERLGARLLDAGHAVTVVSVQDDPDPTAYDAVVVGSGIVAGSVYPAAGQWLTAHARGLVDRPVAVFAVHLSATREPAGLEAAVGCPDQLASTLPQPPVATTLFTGSSDPAGRHWWERVAARLARAPRGDFQDWAAVDAWGGELAERL